MNLSSRDLNVSTKSPLANKKLINSLYAQLNLIYDLLEISSQMICNLYTSKIVRVDINELIKSKDRLDELRKEMINYLSKASPALLNREDWIRILAKLNGIADKSIGITYRLGEACRKKWSIPKDVGENLSNLADKVINSFNIFREIISQISEKPNKALEKCLTIDKLEKMIDDQYRKTSFKILEIKGSFAKKYIVKEITDMFEEISDIIQNMTDDLRIIILNIL